MKKQIISMAALTILILACNKKEDVTNTPKSSLTTRQQTLIGKDWYIKSVVIGTEDVTSIMDSCIKDNIVHHFTDITTGYSDEGATKCDISDPQRIALGWKLINNESRIVIHQNFTSDTFNIESLNSSEFKYRKEDTFIALTTR